MSLLECAKKHNVSIDIIEYLKNTYSDDICNVISQFNIPSRFYYIRVNLLKTTPDELISLFKHKYNLTFYKDDVVSNAVYTLVKGPNEIPVYEKRVIADKVAAEAVYLGSDLYTPGVLQVDKIRNGDLVNILTLKNQIVGAGIAQMNSLEMQKIKKGIAVKTVYSKYSTPNVSSLEEYSLGYFYSQSLPAILVPHILNPIEKDIIVDACASPGGKTTGVAELLKNKGTIIAFDRSKRKVEKIRNHLTRLGLTNTRVVKANILTFARLVKKEFATKILLDPPCSGLGLRPRLYDYRTLSELNAFAEYQKHLLKATYFMLKKDGLLLYSTCTIARNENEDVVLWAINNLRLEPYEISKKFRNIGDTPLSPDLAKTALRFNLTSQKTPGFFISLLRKY